MSNTSTQLTVFLDNIGRTIIGKVSSQDNDVLSVQNPALVHVQPNTQTNQLQLQILPLFFREFQSDKSQATVWHFKKNNITMSEDIPFAEQFIAQYDHMFQPPQAPTTQEEPKVVKLFDEE
jgi:hypothetical protein